MKTYDIEFKDAVHLLLGGEWLKADKFPEGTIFKINESGYLVYCSLVYNKPEEQYCNLKCLSLCKFRIISSQTFDDLKEN